MSLHFPVTGAADDSPGDDGDDADDDALAARIQTRCRLNTS